MHDTEDSSFDDDALARLPRSERPSKTQRKKNMHDLQDLGKALVELPDSRIALIELPETLRDAVMQCKSIRSFEGKRRQMQYIGKLMRHADAEPIREAVAAFKLGTARDALALHDAERWRSELIASDDALTRWVEQHPDSNVQQLRTLIRGARKDAAAPPEQRHGRGYRELFQFIKAGLCAASSDGSLADSSPDSHPDAF